MAIDISKTKGAQQDSQSLSGERQYPSRAGRSHGDAGRPAGRGGADARPRFDVAVPPNGYRWWYIDALSDDGQNGLTIIGFVGSVFSPYYARARKNGAAVAESHCAINVALYGTKRRWAMTERGPGHVSRDSDYFNAGPSSLQWAGEELTISIDEYCAPWPTRLHGKARLIPGHIHAAPVQLDESGRHFWQAVSPRARIVVEFENPKLSWEGHAYHDMNWGDEPLERGFKSWTWARTHEADRSQVLYDVERRDGSHHSFGYAFSDGVATPRSVPPRNALKRGLWGMTRNVLSEEEPRLIATLEDAPFYTRNLVEITLDGAICKAFHESLSLDRFMHPVVQMMLPFRMPRRA